MMTARKEEFAMPPFARRDLEAALAPTESGQAGAACRVAENEPLAPYTTMKIGGPCPAMLFPASEAALARAVAFLRGRGLPWRVLGGGTNLLVADEGISETVINLREMEATLRVEGTRAEVSASWRMPKLAHEIARRGLAGFEFAVGIPGMVGGGVVMNAGAFGKEMKDAVERVYVLSPEGNFAWVEAKDCGFGYRKSRFQRSGETVLRAALSLEKGDPDLRSGLAKMRDYQEKRNSTQPVASQCAGCIFQNPPGLSAGKLVDEAGLKGLRAGGAVVSSVHGNYIVSEGATARDVRALIEKVKAAVKAKAGVELHEEIVEW